MYVIYVNATQNSYKNNKKKMSLNCQILFHKKRSPPQDIIRRTSALPEIDNGYGPADPLGSGTVGSRGIFPIRKCGWGQYPVRLVQVIVGGLEILPAKK